MKSLTEKAEARIKRIENSLEHQPVYQYPGQMFYYVFGFTKSGRKLVDGPFTSCQEADDLVATLDDGEVFEYKTRDLSKATREIKAELLSRGEDPDEVMKRVLHKKGYERYG